MKLYEGESPEQRTENVEERASDTQWVKSHQLQRDLNLATRLGITTRPTTQGP
jgi:hypothetical protein